VAAKQYHIFRGWHLSIHCVIVRPTLSLSANISCLKCPLLTGVCLVTCKHYVNFLLYILVFCIFPLFVLYWFYLRTSGAFINKIIVIVIVIVSSFRRYTGGEERTRGVASCWVW